MRPIPFQSSLALLSLLSVALGASGVEAAETSKRLEKKRLAKVASGFIPPAEGYESCQGKDCSWSFNYGTSRLDLPCDRAAQGTSVTRRKGSRSSVPSGSHGASSALLERSWLEDGDPYEDATGRYRFYHRDDSEAWNSYSRSSHPPDSDSADIPTPAEPERLSLLDQLTLDSKDSPNRKHWRKGWEEHLREVEVKNERIESQIAMPDAPAPENDRESFTDTLEFRNDLSLNPDPLTYLKTTPSSANSATSSFCPSASGMVEFRFAAGEFWLRYHRYGSLAEVASDKPCKIAVGRRTPNTELSCLKLDDQTVEARVTPQLVAELADGKSIHIDYGGHAHAIRPGGPRYRYTLIDFVDSHQTP